MKVLDYEYYYILINIISCFRLHFRFVLFIKRVEMLDSPWEELLHYGLMIGAVIQLVAIAAIILLPERSYETKDQQIEKKGEESDEKTKPLSVSTNKRNRDKGPRRRKK